MSTFKGFLKEVPGVAVDRFETECLQSQFLFLSHCHTDHMVGLSKTLELAVPLFSSEISAVFLRKEFPNLSHMVEPLNIETPLHLAYNFDGEEYNLEVTALPAKHCPGSVMFLFETKDCRVLYTGDFRLCRKDFKKYDILRTSAIECVYLDSTFLMQKYYEFPSREESLLQICTLIKEWLSLDSRNKVIIEMPAQYGIEFLFVGIERRLKEQIYVTPSQWEKYIYCPLLDKCLQPNEAKCRIVAKLKDYQNRTKPNVNATDHVRVIKPTAMYWENWKRTLPFVQQVEDKNEYRVAYSSHCSCSELKDFLEFVKPQVVSLNVVPKNCKDTITETLFKIYNPVKRKGAHVCNDYEALSFDNMLFVPAPEKTKENIQPLEPFLPKRLKM